MTCNCIEKGSKYDHFDPAVQPCCSKDKWSKVQDGHHMTFTPTIFSQHVLLNAPSAAIYTQVTALLLVLVREPCESWEIRTCKRHFSFCRSSIHYSVFSEGEGGPSVCPATAAVPHLSVSDSAQWVNGNLIPSVRSFVHSSFTLTQVSQTHHRAVI